MLAYRDLTKEQLEEELLKQKEAYKEICAKNISLDMFIDCFDKSANGAEKDSDKYTLCLALEKWSKLLSGETVVLWMVFLKPRS